MKSFCDWQRKQKKRMISWKPNNYSQRVILLKKIVWEIRGEQKTGGSIKGCSRKREENYVIWTLIMWHIIFIFLISYFLFLLVYTSLFTHFGPMFSFVTPWKEEESHKRSKNGTLARNGLSMWVNWTETEWTKLSFFQFDFEIMLNWNYA